MVEYANSAGSATVLILPSNGSTWISGKTATNTIVAFPLSAGSYHPVIRQNTASGNVVNLGGLGDSWGFYGYLAATTANQTDWQFTFNSNNGNVTSSGYISASAFYQTSDMRLKTVIPHQHVSVENIAPITYLWKDPKKRASPQVGYSAQEVQKVMPYAVSVADDGMLSVNYIQVLVAKVAELEFKLKKHGLE